MLKPLLIIMLTIPAIASAGVYKCDIDGKTVYQQSPCAKGQAVDIQKSSSSAAFQRQIDAQQTRQNRAELHDMANEIDMRNEIAARAQLRMIAAQNRAEMRQQIRRNYADQFQKRAEELRHDALRGNITGGSYGQAWRNNLADDYERMAREQRR